MGPSPLAAHAERVLKAIVSGEAACSALAASWRRSGRLHALDPANNAPSLRLPEGDVGMARERLGRMLSVAQPSLDRLIAAVGGVGCSVVLADRNGVVVERRGAPGDDSIFEGWGLWTGAVWSEKCEGANGIGNLPSRTAI
jgi:transcriptional regulator of acetoin/glycerol metabolism